MFDKDCLPSFTRLSETEKVKGVDRWKKQFQMMILIN